MNFSMSNKTYDILKWIATVVIPAIGALYFGLSRFWAVPYPTEVLGTMTLIETFMASILGISNATYKADQALRPTIEANVDDNE